MRMGFSRQQEQGVHVVVTYTTVRRVLLRSYVWHCRFGRVITLHREWQCTNVPLPTYYATTDHTHPAWHDTQKTRSKLFHRFLECRRWIHTSINHVARLKWILFMMRTAIMNVLCGFTNIDMYHLMHYFSQWCYLAIRLIPDYWSSIVPFRRAWLRNQKSQIHAVYQKDHHSNKSRCVVHIAYALLEYDILEQNCSIMLEGCGAWNANCFVGSGGTHHNTGIPCVVKPTWWLQPRRMKSNAGRLKPLVTLVQL